MRQRRVLGAIVMGALLLPAAVKASTTSGSVPVQPVIVTVQDTDRVPAGESPRGPATVTAKPDGALVTALFTQESQLTQGSQNIAQEVEPNDTPVTATALLGLNVVAAGSNYPNADVDYWSFSANAGDRLYAATMTGFSASLSFDTTLELLSTDGSTVLEIDDNDGSFGGSSSSIAGKLLPSAGTYYLRVKAGASFFQIRPYVLHVRIQRGAATPEVESNNTPATAGALPAGGFVSGAHQAPGDADYFSIALNAGDSVYLGLDADPERNGVTWNPRLGFGLFGDATNQILAVDDANTVSPNSEALFMTVKSSGTYYVLVDSAASPGGATETYNLSVSVHPATAATAVCATYTSTDTPQGIPAAGGLVSSRILVPGHPRIADLDVSIQLTHAVMADLDVNLRSPAGNNNGLFTDIGELAPGGQSQMDLSLDDEAALPISSYKTMKGIVYQPELNYRLAWFDGEDAGGEWFLDLRDDTSDANGGTLLGWSLTICEPPPPPACDGTLVAVYSNNFESNDGGFTHTGFGGADDWQRGLPTGNSDPILSCNSGTNCWKTNLTGLYSDGSVMQLTSPAISLTGVKAPITASWAMKYQMENASFDTFAIAIVDALNNAKILQRYLDGTMDQFVGVGDLEYINESAGWGLFKADAGAYVGTDIRLAWELASDSFAGTAYSGLAVDDVLVTACCTAVTCSDGDVCTNDVCDPARGCIHPPKCDDGNACTSDSCSPSNGQCTNAPLTGGSCDDANACTLNDTCSAGVCSGTPAPPPGEIGDSLRVAKLPLSATISWSDPPGSYTVYRGIRAGTGSWSYNHTCLGGPVPGSSLGDPNPVTVGASAYYLVARKTACGESVLGRTSSGAPIPNASPCP